MTSRPVSVAIGPGWWTNRGDLVPVSEAVPVGSACLSPGGVVAAADWVVVQLVIDTSEPARVRARACSARRYQELQERRLPVLSDRNMAPNGPRDVRRSAVHTQRSTTGSM